MSCFFCEKLIASLSDKYYCLAQFEHKILICTCYVPLGLYWFLQKPTLAQSPDINVYLKKKCKLRWCLLGVTVLTSNL